MADPSQPPDPDLAATVQVESIADPDDVEDPDATGDPTLVDTLLHAQPVAEVETESPWFHPRDDETSSERRAPDLTMVRGRAERFVLRESRSSGPGGRLGRGGFGEVWQAWDPTLRRNVALKRLRPDLRGGAQDRREAAHRLIAEARITAQLDHPSIVPVHDLLLDGDEGNPSYLMKQVRGRSLGDIVGALREDEPGAREQWSRHRLLTAFGQVCNAVAYAHHRGVVHRDIKPDNIMLGRFGEVFVMDWGLACVLEERATVTLAGADEALSMLASGRSTGMGTAGYSAPEQLAGTAPAATPAADIFALGAVLYEILTWLPAYPGAGFFQRIWAMGKGPPAHPRERAPERQVDDEIAELALQALASDPHERPPTALEMADRTASFLDGRRRREQALALTGRARVAQREVSSLRAEAARLQREAAARLEGVPSWAPVEDKRTGWNLADRAADAERRAELKQVEVLQALRNALNIDRDCEDAHAMLADHHQQAHAAAERARRTTDAEAHELLLRTHDRGRHARYLRGVGALSIVTDPPGARVRLHRYELRDRRLSPVLVSELGETPLVDHELPIGSYLVELEGRDRDRVLYPVLIERERAWDGVPPGETEPTPVPLPAEGELGPDDLFVPPGWFVSGEDGGDLHSLPRRRVWLDGFVIRRFQVTNAEYLEYINDLAARGDEAELDRRLPRHATAEHGKIGPPAYGRDGDRFGLIVDQDGHLWRPDWPVMLIDWHSARAYAAWRAERDGLPWRLPFEMEWEKAGRGVDARRAPWGDRVDPAWACLFGSRPEKGVLGPVTEFATDESPYGVRGLMGNVRDWCLDAWTEDGPRVVGGRVELVDPGDAPGPRPRRGGTWHTDPTYARLAARPPTDSVRRLASIGFRLARPLG